MSDMSPGSRGPDDPSTAKQVVGQTGQAAGEAAGDVKDTVKEQAQRVGAEARSQARSVATDVRDKLNDQARGQNDRLVGGIRQTADQLDEMRGDRADSPAATVVSRVAEGGRQLADYLERNGPDGVLREVQDFARRRPGAFLVTALAAGFVVGRLGKSVAKAAGPAGDGKPASDSFVSGRTTDYPAPTGYPAATGTPAASGYPATSGTPAASGYPATTGTPAASEYPATAGTPATTGYPAGTEYAATGTGRPLVVDEYATEAPERRP
jgi:hypothetical protein